MAQHHHRRFRYDRRWPNHVTMANVIRIKGKTTSGAPALGDLAVREMCYVIPDEALYIKKDVSTIIEVGANVGGATQLTDLSDVSGATTTNNFVLVANGSTFVARALTEADISDLGNYLAAGDIDTLAELNAVVGDATLASQSWVSAQIDALVSGAPGTLDTLNELAAALGDDPNYAATVTASLATKLDANSEIDGGTIS
jgi:hypothetical protein